MTEGRVSRTVVFALGANLGDPLSALRRAVRRLTSELDGARVSAVYVTPAEGGADQPPYLNAVVSGNGAMTPAHALSLAREMEDEEGRERPYPGAPRSLDVDVLFVGDAVVDTPELRLPHPRWRCRDFVVVPLLDVEPDLKDPETGSVVREIARSTGWDSRRFPVLLARGALLAVEAE